MLAGVWLLTTAGVAVLAIEREAATAVHKLVATGFTVQDLGSEGLSITSMNLKPGAVDVLQSHYRDLPAISQLIICCDRELKVLQLPKNAEMLHMLYVSNNEQLTRIEGLAGVTKLRQLGVSGNPALGAIKHLDALSELESLDISNNASLTAIEGLAGLTNLKTLSVNQNGMLSGMKGLDSLTSLHTLMISGPALTNIEGLENLSALLSLTIYGAPSLANINGLARLTNLQSLTIGNTALATIDLAALANLHSLMIQGNTALTTVDLAPLTNLRDLMISHNPALTKIARLASLTQLTTLQLIGNTALSTIDGFEGLGDLSTLMVDGPYASDALARCIRLPALRIVQVESRPELREAAAQFQTLRKKHKLPDVDFYFIPNYAHEEKPELGEPLGQGQDDDEPR